MEIKDLALSAGVAVTLLLGIINLYFNLKTARRTSFINTVTSERVKWIAQVRQNIADLCSLSDHWVHHRTQASTADLQRRIEQLKTTIRLQINPSDPEDLAIERSLQRLPSWNVAIAPEDYVQLQSDLIGATQIMLRREWNRIKREALKGNIS